MSVTGSAPALDPEQPELDQQNRRQGLRAWLRGWYHVLIAELLHVLTSRRHSHI